MKSLWRWSLVTFRIDWWKVSYKLLLLIIRLYSIKMLIIKKWPKINCCYWISLTTFWFKHILSQPTIFLNFVLSQPYFKSNNKHKTEFLLEHKWKTKLELQIYKGRHIFLKSTYLLFFVLFLHFLTNLFGVPFQLKGVKHRKSQK